MPDKFELIHRFSLAGLVTLKSDPRTIALADEQISPLEDEIRLAQGAPEACEGEYSRLFLNPTGAPCHPWQSVYSEEPRLFGPAHHSALGWYRRFGAEHANTTEPADHAGLLLLFYAKLLDVCGEEETLAAFAADHLEWLHGFATKLRDEARHPLMLSLAGEIRNLLLAAGVAEKPAPAAE